MLAKTEGWGMVCWPMLSWQRRVSQIKPVHLMNLRLTLLLLASVMLGSCAYPFGHSKNGHYFGGQGGSSAPRGRIPKELQRERSMF